jgi:hypothetical protein
MAGREFVSVKFNPHEVDELNELRKGKFPRDLANLRVVRWERVGKREAT